MMVETGDLGRGRKVRQGSQAAERVARQAQQACTVVYVEGFYACVLRILRRTKVRRWHGSSGVWQKGEEVVVWW